MARLAWSSGRRSPLRSPLSCCILLCFLGAAVPVRGGSADLLLSTCLLSSLSRRDGAIPRGSGSLEKRPSCRSSLPIGK
eukprot:3054797-Alexandrium_andersonii.AAC.1